MGLIDSIVFDVDEIIDEDFVKNAEEARFDLISMFPFVRNHGIAEGDGLLFYLDHLISKMYGSLAFDEGDLEEISFLIRNRTRMFSNEGIKFEHIEMTDLFPDRCWYPIEFPQIEFLQFFRLGHNSDL
jgi:hypothetical protein